jgi:hypothetical protein
MNRRGFAADPRAIAATEAEVLPIALKLGIVVPVPSVVGSAKTVSMMGQDMVAGDAGLWRQTVAASRPDRTATLVTGGQGRAGDYSGNK